MYASHVHTGCITAVSSSFYDLLVDRERLERRYVCERGKEESERHSTSERLILMGQVHKCGVSSKS
jgi:hypothetical protein